MIGFYTPGTSDFSEIVKQMTNYDKRHERVVNIKSKLEDMANKGDEKAEKALKKIATREAYGDALVEFGAKYDKLVVLDADLAEATKTGKFKKAYPERFFDVGIAEEHAVAFTSALAKGGAKPIYLVMSSFIQRTYDQLSQDLALNNNPAVILVAWGGISGADMTHLCSFDISMTSNIPNLVYLAPTTVEEYMAMLDWAVEQNEHPVIIRQPKEMIHTSLPVDKDYSNLNTYKIEKQGTKVAIIAEGSFFELGENVVKELVKHNIMPTLINPRYLTGVDKESFLIIGAYC